MNGQCFAYMYLCAGEAWQNMVHSILNRLLEYSTNEPDPLVDGIQKRDNPFITKSVCTIL